MIEFYVSGQSLKFFTPVIAADSLNYLMAKVNFAGEEWDGYSKWLHFRQDEELGAATYDIQLNEDDEITADQKLNLTVGQWEIYLTGTKDESRLTTVPVILTVKESGLIDAPLHELPMSVAEQVDFNAKQALLLAQAVKDMADAGEFDGKDGTNLSPLGHFNTVEELEALVPKPKAGDVYSIGFESPYDLYAWDGINLVWRNHGQLQGATGEKGEAGATFIPSVDSNGNISWVNDGGLENPETRNIMGPKGETGKAGEAGPGAYEKAVEAGYTGTEETFYSALTYMPYHNKRHLPGGSDPITVETDNIANAAVTRAKLAQDALYSPGNRITTTTYNIAAADGGNTIWDAYALRNNNITVVLDTEVASNFPVGTEIAFARLYTTQSFTIKTNGIRIANFETGRIGNASAAIDIKLPEIGSMCAIKKFEVDSTAGDLWLVTGNVEVVS